ncbi:TetR/AcrR family transcriptional regulator [Actinocorallia longicatena]|uniref:TetR family transcriptional regulator n=1 Tax=Actinocorallia longicatena TaxID=111803 RepID=A0ABP6QEB4_9ACTN
MAKDARVTRELLLNAGARLFATEGIDAARTRDIVKLAGQGNDSAITYHFGSRQGLLEAILRAGVERMEPVRAATVLDSADLAVIVAAIADPISAELLTEEGRWFLRVIAQVAGRAGVRTHAVPALIDGTAIARQLKLLEQACLAFLPEPLALERVAAFISFLTAALADRAARPEPHLLGHEAFTANLNAMLTAALRA